MLKRILYSKIGAFIVLIPFIKPAAELTGQIDLFIDIWKLIMAVVIFLVYLSNPKKITGVTISVIVIQIIFAFSTVLHNGDIKTALVQGVSIVSVCLYLELLFRYAGAEAFCIITNPIIFMSLLTAFSMLIFYPNGMYFVAFKGTYTEKANYLWGFDNASVFNFIPGMFFWGVSSLYNKNINQRIIVFFCYLFISFSFFYVRSMTAFIACFIITASFLILIVYNKGIRVLNIKMGIIVVLMCSFVLLCYKDGLTYFMQFARNHGKFYSIRARFIFWDKVVYHWKKSILLGYGIEDKLITSKKIIIDHPHNFFMDLLYHGGVLSLICSLFMFGKLFFEKRKKDIITSFSSVCFLTIMIISQMDYYNDRYLFYPLILGVYLTGELNKNRIDINHSFATQDINISV